NGPGGTGRSIARRRRKAHRGCDERSRRLRGAFPRRPGTPDADALFAGEIKLVALGHAEVLVGGVDVAGTLVRAVLVGGVGVDRQQKDRLGVADRELPDLRIREEHALDARVAVDDRRLLARQRALVRLQRDRETAEIADVLADLQRAVDGVLVAQCLRRLRVVLRDEGARALLERCAVLVGPPVVERAGSGVLRSLVVEAVADLAAAPAPD